MKDFKVITVTLDELERLIYDVNYDPVDASVFRRIRFFSVDTIYHDRQKKSYYVVVLKDETIVGVAKVAYYSLNARNENDLSISFCSIDKNYRGLGLSKLMTDAIFAEAARKNYEISTSSYTVLGKMYLQKSFNECAKKYNVVFHDMDEEDGLIDAEWMYVKMPDGKLLHNSEIEK